MLEAVYTKFYEYYDEIPKDTMQSVGRSALFSFAVSLIIVNKLYGVELFPTREVPELIIPLVAAGVAACASLIHGLTTPLFNSVFGDSEVKWYRELARSFIDVTAVYLLFHNLTSVKTHLYSLCFYWMIPANACKSLLDILPTTIGFLEASVGGAPIPAEAKIREIYTFLGWNIEKNSNSAYYAFGF